MCVALERPEILNATKTVASFMQSPTKSAIAKLKREARYLLGSLRPSGSTPGKVRRSTWMCAATGDWAGDEERKRSTTGVAEIFRGHPLDAASGTQALAALSGAEAEF